MSETGRVTFPSGTGIEGPIRVVGPYAPMEWNQPVHAHSWQPGPYLEGYNPASSAPPVPDSLLLVCPCGEVRRVAVPEDVE